MLAEERWVKRGFIVAISLIIVEIKDNLMEICQNVFPSRVLHSA